MIRFLQDYTTKALPPETFAADQEVERSPESELYFVRLGVAGFLVDGVVVDEDYNPIVRETVVVVTTADRRFADTGRGGEVIGLDAPARASSGPGNAVVFAGQPDSIGLSEVEAEQLRADLASAVAGNAVNKERFEQLTGDLTAAQEEAAALHATNRDLSTQLADARSALDDAQTRIAELEAAKSAQEAAATETAAEDDQTATPATTSRRAK